ncbi:MAG: hypothetical protein ACLQPV_10440 [Vulcanimicrobiaceae bacterium]
MSELDPSSTTDPELESWIPVTRDSDFPIQNLPLGIFRAGHGLPCVGVAIGDRIVSCYALAELGLLDDTIDRELVQAPTLNPLLAAGRDAWRALRLRLSELLRAGGDPSLQRQTGEGVIVPMTGARMDLPAEVGDYVDFYSSLAHATNLGKIFRPDGEALMPNWRWMPIGYHGRSGTLVVDGEAIRRPSGQRKAPDQSTPTFGPSTRLDVELEVGFLTGPANALGTPIAVA